MKELGALIRERRERRGMLGYELAEAIGRPPTYISRLETGATKELPLPRDLAAIGRALDLSEREMMQAVGYLSDEPVAEISRLRAHHRADEDE